MITFITLLRNHLLCGGGVCEYVSEWSHVCMWVKSYISEVDKRYILIPIFFCPEFHFRKTYVRMEI